MVTGKEVVSADRRSVSLLQVSLHLGVTGVAARVFMVPFSPRHTALTSRMIRNMSEAMHTEFFCVHAFRALPRSGCPSFFNFVFLCKGRRSDAISPYRFFPRFLYLLYSLRVGIYSNQTRLRVMALAQVPRTWAYGLYASFFRSLQGRGTTLVKESVLPLRDPTAQ
jgi:hypothetical protein